MLLLFHAALSGLFLMLLLFHAALSGLFLMLLLFHAALSGLLLMLLQTWSRFGVVGGVGFGSGAWGCGWVRGGVEQAGVVELGYGVGSADVDGEWGGGEGCFAGWGRCVGW